MLSLHIILDGDGAWPDLNQKIEDGTLEWFREVPGEPRANLSVAMLPAGMASGKPSVAIRIDKPDGRSIVVETSLELFNSAAKAFAARAGVYG